MNADWRSRYDMAIDASHAGGDLALKYFDGSFEVEWKKDQSPVTVADRGAEELIRQMVTKHFPNDGFLGEEFGDQPGTSGYRWIIDPIDGTRSFVRHIPIWATLVGIEYNGEQIGGIAYLPCFKQMYHAWQGDGAYRDSKRIRVSDVNVLGDALMCYSSIGWFRKAGREATFLDLCSQTQRQRGYGDFYGFVLVAQGSVELMVEHGVHPWDVAATKVIVEEAGGRFTDWNNVPTIHTPDVLASNGMLHDETLAILRK